MPTLVYCTVRPVVLLLCAQCTYGCGACLMVCCPAKELQSSVTQKKKISLHCAVSCWSLLVMTLSSRLEPNGVTHSGISISPTTFVFHSLFIRSPESLCPEHSGQKRPFPSCAVSCVGHSDECCKRCFFPRKNTSHMVGIWVT